jgi:hypothetical protein
VYAGDGLYLSGNGFGAALHRKEPYPSTSLWSARRFFASTSEVRRRLKPNAAKFFEHRLKNLFYVETDAGILDVDMIKALSPS